MRDKHKHYPPPDFHYQKPEVKLNIMAAFVTAQQTYLTTVITMAKSQTLFIVQPRAPGMCHPLSHLYQQVNDAITMFLAI